MAPFASGTEAVAALPKALKVGAFLYTIERWSNHEAMGTQRYGEHESYRQTIRIQENMPTAQKTADTFLHEALHAIFFTYGICDDDREERTVGALSMALVALHRDNPWLADWLTACLST